jgi:putrescine transport system substrate-binding protein
VRTGIRPVLDLYDSNEILEAKLLAGSSGYDLVFPTARPFAARHIKAGIYLPLDRDKLPGLNNLDPEIMKSLEDVDPGHKYLVPYMWGTTGLGINFAKVAAALGGEPGASWDLVFDPAKAEKLAGCGISLLDDPTEVYSAALAYLGKDPNSRTKEDLEAAQALLKQARPHIRYFHSSQYISDLANGDTCVAMGYSGDVLQAKTKAEEAANGVQVTYLIPKEGAMLWVDVMAIPKDAPNPVAAHAFIEYLLDPKVIAAASDYVSYANPNSASLPYLDEELRTDPGVYPSPEVRARLFVTAERSDKEMRELNRMWTRLKADR